MQPVGRLHLNALLRLKLENLFVCVAGAWIQTVSVMERQIILLLKTLIRHEFSRYQVFCNKEHWNLNNLNLNINYVRYQVHNFFSVSQCKDIPYEWGTLKFYVAETLYETNNLKKR